MQRKTMALSKPVVEVPEDDLTCDICKEPFEDPVVTPCGHTFCRGCLCRCLAARPAISTAKVLNCPRCRGVIKLGVDGVKALPRNYILNRILESRKTEAKISCMLCTYEAADAIHGCLTCEMSFCANCFSTDHSETGTYAGHQIAKPQRYFDPSPETLCSKHGEKIVMFCCHCGILLCDVCEYFSDGHVYHDVASLGTLYRSEQIALAKKSGALQVKDAAIKETISKLRADIKVEQEERQRPLIATEKAYRRMMRAVEREKAADMNKLRRESEADVEHKMERISTLETRQTANKVCFEQLLTAIKGAKPTSFLASVIPLQNRLDAELVDSTNCLNVSEERNIPTRDNSTPRVRTGFLLPDAASWIQRRFFFLDDEFIKCPELTFDADSAFESVKLQHNNKQLINVKQPQEGDLCCGVLSSKQSFTRGLNYFEIEVEYTERIRLNEDNLIMSAGMCHSGHTSSCVYAGEDEHSWGVLMGVDNGILCFYTPHNDTCPVVVPVIPDSDIHPVSGKVRLGFLLDIDQKRLTLVDCTHDRVLYIHDGLDLTEPLTPVVGAYNYKNVYVCITLVSRADIESLPRSIETPLPTDNQYDEIDQQRNLPTDHHTVENNEEWSMPTDYSEDSIYADLEELEFPISTDVPTRPEPYENVSMGLFAPPRNNQA